MAKTYLCENPACTLGTVGSPGRFAGGITKEALNVLSGKPLEQMASGEDYGPGFCPNCGHKGTEEA